MEAFVVHDMASKFVDLNTIENILDLPELWHQCMQDLISQRNKTKRENLTITYEDFLVFCIIVERFIAIKRHNSVEEALCEAIKNYSKD
jgi:hypothetical protein